MSEISRVGKESGRLQHQFYQVTLPLQTHFDVLVKHFRLQIDQTQVWFWWKCLYEKFQESRTWGLHL